MKRSFFFVMIVAANLLLAAPSAFAQGIVAGNIAGRVAALEKIS